MEWIKRQLQKWPELQENIPWAVCNCDILQEVVKGLFIYRRYRKQVINYGCDIYSVIFKTYTKKMD